MTDDAQGIAGDRRRNPFPSMTETEYQLFRATIREDVAAGVSAAMIAYRKDNCAAHIERTDRIEATLFGRAEIGVVGMDQQVAEHTRALREMSNYVTWLKVTLTASLLSLVVGLAVLIIGK